MRKTTFPRFMILVGIAGAVAVAPAAAQAQVSNEPPVNVDQSARYEDDAWYDVTEWFDGNDYNPTDEAIGRWDNEYYDHYEAAAGDDQDNDRSNLAGGAATTGSAYDGGYSGYGYYDNNTNAADDFVYDYYDDRYNDYYNTNDDQNYEYYTDYVDSDADGVYDYYVGYTDTDGDGYYDRQSERQYFGQNQQGNNQQANARAGNQQVNARTNNQQANAQTDQANKQTMRRSSRMVSVSGQVKSVKEVQTPSGKRLVAQMPSQQQGQQEIAVDLGPIGVLANEAKRPAQGDQLQARGPIVTIGEKNVLLAQTVTMNGKEIPIHRYGRDYTGTVESTKTANLRGQQHQVVTMRTQDGKRLTVDLGPVDQLNLGQNKLQANQQIRVSGPAVKVQDRPLLVARQVSINGQTMEIRPDLGQMNTRGGNQQQMQNRNQQGRAQQGQNQNQTRQGQRNANPQDETNRSQQGQNQNRQNRDQNSGQQGSNQQGNQR